MLNLDIPRKSVADIIKLDDYIKAYSKAKHVYDQGYLDKFLEIHILDIFDNFLNDYFSENVRQLELTNIEKDMYRYNPKALSTYLYGTPDLWMVILRLNELDHPGELDFKKPVYIPIPEAYETFYRKIDRIKEELGGEWLDVKDNQVINR